MMANLYQLRAQLLRDQRITDDEVAVIREYIERDGRLDLNDVRFLVDLLSDAREVCPAFDDLFFPVLREVILADGQVGLDEHFYLLKMLYSNGTIRERERQFLSELRAAVERASPEFDALCAEVDAVPACR
jgi:hypothetical protein